MNKRRTQTRKIAFISVYESKCLEHSTCSQLKLSTRSSYQTLSASPPPFYPRSRCSCSYCLFFSVPFHRAFKCCPMNSASPYKRVCLPCTLHIHSMFLLNSHLSSLPKTWARNLNKPPHHHCLQGEAEQKQQERIPMFACKHTFSKGAGHCWCLWGQACRPAALPACAKMQQKVLHLPDSPHGYPCLCLATHLSVCWWLESLPFHHQARGKGTPPGPSGTRQGGAIFPDTGMFSIVTPRTVFLIHYHCWDFFPCWLIFRHSSDLNLGTRQDSIIQPDCSTR